MLLTILSVSFATIKLFVLYLHYIAIFHPVIHLFTSVLTQSIEPRIHYIITIMLNSTVNGHNESYNCIIIIITSWTSQALTLNLQNPENSQTTH